MGFWQNMIDKRTEIEVRKKELQLEAQTGVRAHPFLGDIGPSIKTAYHSITKYPRMLIAGFTGAGTVDRSVDMPEMPHTFAGTDLEADLTRKRDEAQKRIDEEEKAYKRIFVDNDAGLWNRYKEYHQYKSIAEQNKFRESLTVPVKASLAAGLLGAVATGAAKAITRHSLDASGATNADLGSLVPTSWFSGLTDSISSYVS